MSAPQRETIYIDIDDEITAVIDKVQSTQGRIVALVLPKRATVFQSIVNMKLLKRAAAESRKSVVLITSEAALLPMAGAVGLHVAKSLQTKPVVPSGPGEADSAVVDADDDASEQDAPPEALVDRTRPVGELAGMAALAGADDAIEVDDDIPEQPAQSDKPAKKKAFNRKLAVPNFERFRSRLFLLGLGVALVVVAWIFAFYILPKATVTITTNNTLVDASVKLTAAKTATQVDADKLIVPAVFKEYKKTDTQKVPATGKKDMGTKAEGSVTLSLGDCSKPQVSVPQGTAVAAGGKNFITQSDITLTSVQFGSQCRNKDFKEVSTATVQVVAQNAGDDYNLAAQSYTVAGVSNVSGYGNAMTGGTSKVVTVVSQSDIDAAKQKIMGDAKSSGKDEVSKLLNKDGYTPIDETLEEGDPLVTASPNVDQEASDVTVTLAVTYKMMGMQQAGVKQLVENEVKKKIDTTQQNILNDGIDTATVQIEDQRKAGEITLTMRVQALAGVQQDENEIKQFVIGKKKGEAISQLKERSGIKNAKIEYNLPWIYSTPHSAGKISVVFEKADEASN